MTPVNIRPAKFKITGIARSEHLTEEKARVSMNERDCHTYTKAVPRRGWPIRS